MKIFQPQNFIKPPLLPVFILSVIQFDKFFHPVVLYEKYLIGIFMNSNENFSNERKYLRKIKGCILASYLITGCVCCGIYKSRDISKAAPPIGCLG